MTREDLKKQLDIADVAMIGDYSIKPIPAVKGKYGVIKKPAVFRLTRPFLDDFSKEFETLDAVLAYKTDQDETIGQMLSEAKDLAVPFC